MLNKIRIVISFLALFFTLSLITSCKKDNIDEEIQIKDSIGEDIEIKDTTINSTIGSKDSILFHDFEPDIILTATKSSEEHLNTFCSSIPIPTDSTAIYLIDLNNDSINDFSMSVKRWDYNGSGSSFSFDPCLRYKNHFTNISSLNSTNKISIKSDNYAPLEFNKGEIIGKESTWNNWTSGIYVNSIEVKTYQSPFQEEFHIGVIVNKDSKDYYGWILIESHQNRLIIKEIAINLSENQKIIAGQKTKQLTD